MAREIDEAQTTTPMDERLSEHRDRQAAKAKVEEALERIHPRYARIIQCAYDVIMRRKPGAGNAAGNHFCIAQNRRTVLQRRARTIHHAG